MQEAKWVMDSFIKCFVIRVRLRCFSFEKLVGSREIQNFHGALLQDILYYRKARLFVRLDPNATFCCLKNRESSFDTIFGRKKQCLHEREISNFS